MRFELSSPSPTISLDNFGTVESDALKGIDSNEYDPAVSVDAMLGVSVANGMEY